MTPRVLLRNGAGEMLDLGFIHAPLLRSLNAVCQMDGGVRVIHGGAQRIKSDKLVGYRNQRVFGEADV